MGRTKIVGGLDWGHRAMVCRAGEAQASRSHAELRVQSSYKILDFISSVSFESNSLTCTLYFFLFPQWRYLPPMYLFKEDEPMEWILFITSFL